MNSISGSNGYYPPTAQSQMNAPSRGFQENQLALTPEEKEVLQRLIQLGVVPASTAAALVSANQTSQLGVSALGLAGAAQGFMFDQSIGEELLGKYIRPFKDTANRNYFDGRYLGENGVNLWQRTASKHGMQVFGTDGKPLNPNVKNLVPKGPALEMHTVMNTKGDVLTYQPVNNGFWRKVGNIAPQLRGTDTSGAFDDSVSKTRGHSAAVVSSGKQYSNALEKLEKLRNTAGATPEAIKAAEAAVKQNLLEFDQIRLQEAAKTAKNFDEMLKLETKVLDDLPAGSPKYANQLKKVDDIKKLAEAQSKHLIKLNTENANFVATETAQNVDDLAKGLMKKPNLLQKAANFFNADRTKSMQLYNQLKSHGFSKEQLQEIQKAVMDGDENAVKSALQNAAKDNMDAAQNFATKGLNNLDNSAKAALNATVDSKASMGALRNRLGLAGKLSKGLAVVGTVAEIANFGVNMKNGNQRTAFSDLTTNVGAGLATTALVGALGLTFLPALAVGIVAGVGISKVAAPWVDKAFKWAGLTNKNERDAKKAKEELQQFNQTLASAPTGMAPA
jgi:hypothetical protein